MKLITSGDHLDCMEVLWKFGLDLDFCPQKSPSAQSLAVILYLVGRTRPRTLRWVLKHSISLEVSDGTGSTPLLAYLACTYD